MLGKSVWFRRWVRKKCRCAINLIRKTEFRQYPKTIPEMTKLSLFEDDMMLYVERLKYFIKNIRNDK